MSGARGGGMVRYGSTEKSRADAGRQTVAALKSVEVALPVHTRCAWSREGVLYTVGDR